MLRSEPDMFMPPESKQQQCDRALQEAFDATGANARSPEIQAVLWRIDSGTYCEAFRRVIIGDPATDVEPLLVRRKATVHVTNCLGD